MLLWAGCSWSGTCEGLGTARARSQGKERATGSDLGVIGCLISAFPCCSLISTRICGSAAGRASGGGVDQALWQGGDGTGGGYCSSRGHKAVAALPREREPPGMELPPPGWEFKFQPLVPQPGAAATRAGRAGNECLTHSLLSFALCS